MFRKLIATTWIVVVGIFASPSLVGAQGAQPTNDSAAVQTSNAPPTGVEQTADDGKPGEPPDEGGASGAKKKNKAKKELTVDERFPFSDVEPDSYWLPAQGAQDSNHVDVMFYIILGLSIFCFVAITCAVVYLTLRYRNRPGHRAEDSRAHDNVLEVTWTVIPSIICVFIFLGGWKGYLNMTTAPGDSIEIDVLGKKWNWIFKYKHGADVLDQQNVLHVPVDRSIKLIMRSEDVLHSFYVPMARVKQDVIPSRYTYLTFKADKPGVYKVYCAEFCGDSHSDMKTRVVVHEPGGYDKWLLEAIEATKIDCKVEFPDDAEARAACYQGQGEGIYIRLGCKQCHSIDGSAGTGPTFQGMWGQTRSFTDGSSSTVDENYVRESVLEPMAKVRTGFSPVMPTFKGKLKDKDIDALNHWMKGLK